MNFSKCKPRIVGALIGRDEASNLPKTLSSIFHQTLPLKKLIYVDDASIDDSANIAEQYGCEVVRLTKRHESYVGRVELAFILNEFIKRIDFDKYDFMFNTGADVVFPKDYLERLVAYMMNDDKLVIASGVIQGEYNVPTSVRGAGRLYKTWFWKRYIKKFPFNYTYETYPLYKAMERDLVVLTFSDLVMATQRATKTYKATYGYAMRELGYIPFYVLVRCVIGFFKDPETSIKMLATYLCSPYLPYDQAVSNWTKRHQQHQLQDWIKNPLKIFSRIKKETIQRLA